jgi:L-galactose dehydrogenase
LAETVLGKALKELPRDAYCLATKVGRYGDAEFDFSAARVTKSVDESLARLNVDYIDVIQCHDIEFGSLDQVVNETLPALEKVREQGKVGFIGITGLPLEIFRYVIDRANVDTILSYCHYSLNDTALAEWVPYLQKEEVGIISASPLSMRLLTEQGPPDWHPAPEDIQQACAKAAAHCRKNGVDIAKLAVQFGLANTDIATTLVGTANPDNLRKNVDWALSEFDDTLLAEVLEILTPIHNKTWLSGIPENQ